MELFGIIFAVPAALIAAVLYSLLMRLVPPFRGITRTALLWLSTAVLGGLLVEWGTLLAVGAVRSRAIIGPAFYPLHLVLFFLAVPALANVLLITRSGSVLGSWFVMGSLCSVLALPVVLTQYLVAEALYGSDGRGGPYGEAPTIPMPVWW